MTQQDAHTFLANYPDGVPTLALKEFIGLSDATGIRSKAGKLNGLVNFDRAKDTFDHDQLRAFLPHYKRATPQQKSAIRALLLSLGAPTDTLPKTQPSPQRNQQNSPNKSQRTTSKNQSNPEPIANENQLKTSFLTKRGFLLTVVIGLVIAQSSHFALYYIGRIGEDGLAQPLTVTYGIIIGLLVEAMALILVANGRSRNWLKVIAIISFSINGLFYEAYNETEWNLFGELLLASVVPGCIYLISELYVEK